MAGRLQDERAPEMMHQQSRNGWFYRVLTPGETASGDKFILLDRPVKSWPLTRLQRIIFSDEGTAEELAAVADMPFLAQVWRDQAKSRLQTTTV